MIRSSSLHSSSRSILRFLDPAQFQDLSSRAFLAREGMRHNHGAVGEVETEAASCSSCLNTFYGFGMALVWFWYGFGMVLVWLWYGFRIYWSSSLNIVSTYQLANEVLRTLLPEIPFRSHCSGQVGWPIGHSMVDTELRGNRASISRRVPEQPPRIAPHAEQLDIWQHCEMQKETPHIWDHTETILDPLRWSIIAEANSMQE